VVATLALFVALGGGAYAAIHLPRNSVGPGQLRKNSVNGAKVRDGSLTGEDLKPGTIPTPPTPPAPPAPTARMAPLKKGETMTGVIAIGLPNIEEQPRKYFAFTSFPVPPPEPIPVANQHLVSEETPACPGIGQAAPGQLCVFRTALLGAKNPIIVEHSGAGGATGPAGFGLRVESTGIGLEVRWSAIWAYTAP
jgi:hypothetical protein